MSRSQPASIHRSPPRGAWRVTLHGRFDRIAARHPAAPAVACGGHAHAYADVAAASRRVAAHLRRLGVGPGDAVGVCLERSAEFVVAVLAILRCGAAYAPLPLDYPPARLLGMVDDAGIRLLVSGGAARDVAAGLIARRGDLAECVLDPGWVWDRSGAGRSAEPATADAGAESPAYVMFTSGSTGRPRGVVVPHRAVAGLVIGQSYVDFGPGLRTLLLAPTAFDASTFELWAPLLHGGTVVVHPAADFDPRSLGASLREGRVNCLWLTAGLFNLVVDLMPSALSGVGHVLTGGDVLSVEHVRRAFAALPGIRLTNGYGPTETTTFATTHPIDPLDPAPHGRVPIGRPLAHTICRIVDERGGTVSGEGEGELWIGGSGVALGYLTDDPQAFVTVPGEAGGVARQYRSGDRCRREADGSLSFLGRIDRQVKIRGHRVEPAGIESLLATHPLIRDAVVLPCTGGGETSLSACVVRRDGSTAPVAGLREWLLERLPTAAVPGRMTVLERLPVTANGKVDRAALLASPAEIRRSEPPRGPVETLLAGLWEETLGRGGVGRDDDFLRDGGDSLAAMRLVTRIEMATGTRLPVRTVFEHPRLADLAAALVAAGPGAVPVPEALAARPRGGDRPVDLPALAAQRGMWVLQQLLPDPATYNQPFAFAPRGDVDWARIRRRLEEAVDRHPALRSALVEDGGALVQRVMPVGAVPLPWREEPGVGPDRIGARLAARVREPFDLAAAPLWGATLFPHAAPHGVLLLSFHHAIIDDWSLGLLLDELGAARAAAPAWPGRPPSAPGDAAAARAFWARTLAGAPAGVDWPPRPGADRAATGRGAVVRFAVPAPVVRAWRQVARSRQATLFHAWLGACHLWLQGITGRSDSVVLTPLADRAGAALAGSVGCHLNTLPVRLRRAAGAVTAAEITAAARAVFLDAAEHARLPFDEIVAAVPGAAGSRLQPLANVALVLLERPGGGVRFGEVPVERLDVHTGTARFDLTLSLFAAGPDDGADGVAEYSLDVLDEAAVRGLVDRFLRLLATVADDAAADLDAIASEGGATSGDGSDEPPWHAVPRHDPPRGDTETTLARIWSELLGGAGVSRDDRFFDLGGNSLLGVRVIHALEAALGVRLPLRALFEAPRLADLAALVDRARQDAGRQGARRADAQPPEDGFATVAAADGSPVFRSLVPLKPGGGRAPLFVCHGIFGGIWHFRPLAEALGDDIPVYGLIGRGFGGDGAVPVTMEEMITAYADEVERFRPSGIIHLAGWSAGGWYAYEMARRLAGRGRTVGLVALLDTHRGPRLPPAVGLAVSAARLSEAVGRWRRRLARLTWSNVARRASTRWTPVIAARPGGEPRAVDGDPWWGALLGHRTGRYDGTVDLFLSAESAGHTRLLWRTLCRGGVRPHAVPARHNAMLDGEAGRRIARRCRERMDEAEAGHLPERRP